MSGVSPGLGPVGESASEQAAAWFVRLRADDASDADRAAWQQWIALDECNRAAFARLQARWDEMGTWSSEPAVVAILSHLPRGQAPKARIARRRGRVRHWLAAAATIAGVAFAAAWWVQADRAVDIEYATAVGEKRVVELEDGTRLTLDTDTRLDVAYSRHERVVRLERGRALFEVVREGRPLRVASALGEIRVVGTTFEVDQHAGGLAVTLVEGIVDVQPARKGWALERLVPGERLSISGDGRAVRSLAPPEAVSWKTGRLVFDDRSLAEAVAEFGRYSEAPIRLGDPSLAGIRVSGAFRSDDPSGFLEAMQLLHGVSSSVDASGTIVLSRK